MDHHCREERPCRSVKANSVLPLVGNTDTGNSAVLGQDTPGHLSLSKDVVGSPPYLWVMLTTPIFETNIKAAAIDAYGAVYGDNKWGRINIWHGTQCQSTPPCIANNAGSVVVFPHGAGFSQPHKHLCYSGIPYRVRIKKEPVLTKLITDGTAPPCCAEVGRMIETGPESDSQTESVQPG
jgi:hypothetical protein